MIHNLLRSIDDVAMAVHIWYGGMESTNYINGMQHIIDIVTSHHSQRVLCMDNIDKLQGAS
jgi:hypothetical protein